MIDPPAHRTATCGHRRAHDASTSSATPRRAAGATGTATTRSAAVEERLEAGRAARRTARRRTPCPRCVEPVPALRADPRTAGQRRRISTVSDRAGSPRADRSNACSTCWPRCPTAPCCAATATSSPTPSPRCSGAAARSLTQPDWRKATVWTLERDDGECESSSDRRAGTSPTDRSIAARCQSVSVTRQSKLHSSCSRCDAAVAV